MGKRGLFLIGCCLALAGAQPSPAANHYVRQGASGNGSDWANA